MSARSLSEGLRRWKNLEECLIHEFCWADGLYSADLAFNVVWGPDGRIRRRVLEEPRLVTFRLTGIERLGFEGALTEGMKRSPERINWGLAEVAGVGVAEVAGLLVLRVSWESERHLEAACVSIDLIEPDGLVA